ncbi:Polypyrimidine tract-binding protein-like protein 3 [Diplonema papillatum]|nr:Polypyrimidine tract-binding protein-like protein 3 [Diplonema papillatum]
MSVTPSPVLMIRSVPDGITEKDLEDWARSFHYVTSRGEPRRTECKNSLLLQDRLIGFVQMEDVEQAKCIMDVYYHRPDDIRIKGRNGISHPLNLIYSDKQQIRTQSRPRSQIPTSETRILLVVLKDLNATIMMDELFWIFSQFGRVEKLSSFTKDLKNQVLVQYNNKAEASIAMSYLNGRQIEFISGAPDSDVRGTCQLGILPSRLPELTFKNQDQKNRDYSQINTTLEWHFQQSGNNRQALTEQLKQVRQNYRWAIRDFLWGEWVMGDGWLTPKQLSANEVGRIPEGSDQKRGIPQGQVGDCVHFSKLTSDKELEGKKDEMGRPYPPMGDLSAEQMWRLCGQYGNIVAAKILYKYQDSAIVQFSRKDEADYCIRSMKDASLWGAKWEVKESKHANAMHWSGANTSELDKLMCTMRDHSPPEKPREPASRPSRIITLWDVPENCTREDLFEIIGERGPSRKRTYSQVDDVTMEPTGHGFCNATVTMVSPEDAVIAISTLNGEDVMFRNGRFRMKMRFSKDEDGLQRAGTNVPMGGFGHHSDEGPHSGFPMQHMWTA